MATKPSAIPLVTGILQGYADRAVFRGFGIIPSGKAGAKTRARFQIVWHYDRPLELVLDASKKTLRFPALLPAMPAGSSMYREFQQFLEERHFKTLLPHRRVDRKKAHLQCSTRNGVVSVTMVIHDGDFEYATRRLIHVMDEVFQDFLGDGRYFDYLVENFGLDPDRY